MAALSITDTDVMAEADRRGIPHADLDQATRQAIRRDLAQGVIDARRAARPVVPDHLTVVIQVRQGDVVLSTSEQNIPLNPNR